MKLSVLALASLLHLVPHPFGVSTIGAAAIYGGAKGDWRISWLVPLVPLFIGNLIWGFYDPTILVFVYAGFAVSALAANLILKHKRNQSRYGLAVATGAFIFFLISNFSVWLAGMYPPTAAGLAACYINGLPYLGTAMLADGIYSLLLFALHELIDRQRFSPAAA